MLAELHAGRIQFLRRQVRFRITIRGVRICSYVADFVYVQHGRQIVEDVKGMRTPVYKLKRRLMAAALGIEVKET